MMRMLQMAGDVVAPRRCVFCGVLSAPTETTICNACHRELPWAERAAASAEISPNPFESIIAPLHYSFPVDAAIKAFKFHRKLHYSRAFEILLTAAAQQLPDDIDAILPVPLHRWRRIGRGFNQAEELARPLARKQGLPILRNVRRVHHTAYQSGMDAVKRRRNMQRAFAVRGEVAAAHVLIVDDVITTGETCRQLACVLFDAGVEKVSVLAIAR